MLNRFWMWLLGFKDPNSEGGKSTNQTGNLSASNSPANTTGEDEGNFRSGPDGYQGGGYEGR